MTSRLLLLVHRIPYPPNKGDKIRSYHLLRHLAARHEVYLGAFVDDAHDWQYERELAGLCRQVKLIGLDPVRRKLASLAGLLTGEALSVPYYRIAAMQRWVDTVVPAEGIERAVVFSSTMAQFVAGPKFAQLRRIADLCDVDSDKWRQYAEGRRAPMKWLYAREARALLAYERRIAREFDATLFVTRAEAELFRKLAPESGAKVGFFDNGVDTEYFDPDQAFDSPYAAAADEAVGSGAADSAVGPVAVFTGAMDYWANVDAVTWFADEIWPRVRAAAPRARFFIVGSKPGAEVKALESRPGIHVTGRVPDVRPYLAHADVAVAPLRIARGTQNKVLEALAMARPVACTPAAAAGLSVPAGAAFRIEEDPGEYARAVLALFGHGAHREGRERVIRDYGWAANLRVVDELLDQRSESIAA
ncbi:MAG: TIGR03087 family PEP-CTERM/XrtA system glycosyltransferase [Burkholderiales bacterium]|nr:TIGR03087 family PEP-CTERM/XrtA system glycosyltransferase [Burkholderiales bacterium]OJX08690.1 MAG: sugar transferase [Burkholderiales bacterium 70-64]